jgi:peptide/nickel transport system substrate-binding protein
MVTMLVFNKLLQFGWDKPDISPQNIVPELAQKWEVSADGRTYTFNLEKNVKWSDGTAFTADDVVYNLEKMADPQRSSLAGSLRKFTVQKVDDFTVKVVLESPQPSFLVTLAGPYASIQPKSKAAVDQKSTDFLMGTGPFIFKSMVAGVSYTFVKNPNYWRKDAANNPLPYLDGVVMSIVNDRNAQADNLLTGNIDMSCPQSGITNFEVLDRIRKQGTNITIAPQPLPYGFHFWFNLNNPNLKDVRVRKAIALLIDPKELATARNGSDDFANFNAVLLPPPYNLPKAEQDKLLGRDMTYDQRIAEAKKLMADAGKSAGFKLIIAGMNLPETKSGASLIADKLKRYLNIDSEMSMLETSASRNQRDSGEFGIYYDSALALTGDPDDLMPYFVSGQPSNFMKYSNTKLDQLWKDQSLATDYNKRMQITQEIERILLTDLPVAPVSLASWQIAWRNHVKNLVVHNSIYGPETSMERVWLNK